MVCVGGTSIRRSLVNGNFAGNINWADAGGGQSEFEPIPSYQSSISSVVGTARGVPDISADANPADGVWVYDGNEFGDEGYGWFVLGGTSVATPLMAGIVNNAATLSGKFAASSNAELTTMYANKAVTTDFTDLTVGYCGPYSGYLLKAGWDFCTGIGQPYGYTGK